MTKNGITWRTLAAGNWSGNQSKLVRATVPDCTTPRTTPPTAALLAELRFPISAAPNAGTMKIVNVTGVSAVEPEEEDAARDRPAAARQNPVG